jgi:TolB protein
LVVQLAGGASASRGLGARFEAAGPRTIAVLPAPIWALDADGRRLAWRTNQLQVFDRFSHRLTTIARSPYDGCFGDVEGPVLAGTRVRVICMNFSNLEISAGVESAALGDRRLRAIAGFSVYRGASRDSFGDLYFPARIAGGGGTLAFFGIDATDERRRRGLWRMVGRHARWLPYEPPLPADIAVAGRRLASLSWVIACSCDRLPAWSPDGQEIAWNHAGTIWLMGADGGGQHPLAQGARPESAPRWSPSGSTLAFESGDSISLIERDGSNQRRLVTGALPAWSPDGTRLAFVRGNDLRLVGADGSGEQRLTNDALPISRPDWSPDGRTLVVARGGDLYLVDVATGLQRDLTPGTRSDSDPVWSPDGTRIAFAGYTGDWPPRWIYTIEENGAALRQVTAGDEADDLEPAWSPDGQRIAYSAGWSFGREQVWVVNADGSRKRMLKTPSYSAEPAWSPDGKTIVAGDAYTGAQAQAGIYALDPVGGPAKPLTPTTLTAAVEIRDSHSAKLLHRWELPKQRSRPDGYIAVSRRYALATYWRYRVGYALERFDIPRGAVLGVARFPWKATRVDLSGRRGVYRIGRQIYLLDVRSGRRFRLARTGADPAGPVIEGKHVFWAQAYRKGSRVRELVLR